MNIKNDRHRAEPKVEMILTGEIRWCFVASGEREWLEQLGGVCCLVHGERVQ